MICTATCMTKRAKRMNIIMDDFLWRAVAGGLGVALVAGPLGCFIAWRRMAYFGDTLAHVALLGVAAGVLLGVDVQAGIIAVCAAAALLLAGLERKRGIGADSLLGIMSHGALAVGLVVLSFFDSVRVDLTAYLFGDMLAIAPSDLIWIGVGGAAVLLALAYLWRPLLALTVHEELARVEGFPVETARVAFLLLIALVVAVSMKIVGILPIAALLVVPAATARPFARSPLGMTILAAVAGAFAVLAGLSGSYYFDTPAGPSVAAAAVALFALLLPFGVKR